MELFLLEHQLNEDKVPEWLSSISDGLMGSGGQKLELGTASELAVVSDNTD